MAETPAVQALEAPEIAAWRSLFDVAPGPFAEAVGLETAMWGDALFTVSARIDSTQFNRLQMPASAPEPGDDRIARAVERFRAAQLKHVFVQIAPGPHAAAEEARARAAGLVPYHRAWAKFWRGPEPVPAVSTDLRIEAVTGATAEVFGRTTALGFGMPDAMAAWLAAAACAPGWRCYLSYDGDQPTGGGALFLDGRGGAWLGMGSTLQGARGRGGQSAILARRIADAVDAGARVLVTETGTAVPGQPQTSYQNILKAGFRVAYERPNWTWAAT